MNNGGEIHIAIAGNPNSGKSSLFNALTGLNQKTGNLPGVTVERKSGSFSHGPAKIKITDIPGLYSMVARSPDELIASSFILDNSKTAPDLFVFVADSTALRKSLFLFQQMKESGCPMILALNMSDRARSKGIKVNVAEMEALLEVPVVEISARYKTGLDTLKDKIVSYPRGAKTVKTTVKTSPENTYAQIEKVLKQAVYSPERLISRSTRADKWIMHPFWGYVIFFSLLFIIFQSVFSLAEYPMDLIEGIFLYTGGTIESFMPPGVLTDLVVKGILPGLSGVFMFIPQIALLFLFLSALEDSGYMVRAALLMDRVMRRVGLSGRSMIPLISGAACAIPAIMSARTIPDRRQRLITMFVTPLVSCSARLPVFILLVSLLGPDKKWLGIFNYQGLILTLLYLFGFLATFLSAMLLNRTMKQEGRDPFLIEVPEYHTPHWRNVVLQIYTRCLAFVTQSGKIILSISIILWALCSYGPSDFSTHPAEPTRLETSFAGMGGRMIEPVIKPLGYDWKIGIAIISSFAAREVFVGTVATIYNIGDENNTEGIHEKLERETNVETGMKVYTPATIVSLLLFYLFALQCMSTVAVMKKETGSWRWPVLQFAYMGLLAYVSAFLAYQILS